MQPYNSYFLSTNIKTQQNMIKVTSIKMVLLEIKEKEIKKLKLQNMKSLQITPQMKSMIFLTS